MWTLLCLLACRPSSTPSSPNNLDDTSDTTDTDGAGGDDTAPVDDTGGPAGCEEPGCLVSWARLETLRRADLEPLLAPGVEITSGYEVYFLSYRTAGGVIATGTVTLPYDAAVEMPAAGGPGVVNAPGPIGRDDPCRLSGTGSGAALAGLFGARGAIGVAPDYPGLGGPGLHHYLDAYEEATSVLDAIRAAQNLAAERSVPSSGRAAVVGLSQGGHATLAAAAWHSRYAPELDIRAFGASGPASVFVEHWQQGARVPGTHMVLHAMLAWSFADAAGVSDDGVWADGQDPAPHLLSRCGWSPTLDDAPTLYEDFPVRAEKVFSEAVLNGYLDGSFDGFPFMVERFAANRITPWLEEGTQTAPIAIWQGELDDVVPAAMTQELVAALRAGGIDVDLHLVPGSGHTDTAFGFLATNEAATEESVAWVLGLLAAE